MEPERWRRVEELYHAVCELKAADQVHFLNSACGNDEDLRREVESLLEQTGTVLERPAWEARQSGSLGEQQQSGVHLNPGSQLGHYQILQLLGSGGMGQVYKAFDPRLRREVAIKVAAERFSTRFDREARAAAALNHPNICTVFDVGPNYLVMELIQGETLRAVLRRGLSPDSGLAIGRQVLEALNAAHCAGVIHRDLKPENVMVRVDGNAKVLDFGLAKWMQLTGHASDRDDTVSVSRSGQILGTVTYMSPEQIQGLELDQRSDLFAFGILLYELLSGRHPWPRPSPVDTLHAILHDDPPPMDTLFGKAPPSAGLERVVRKSLAKEPAQRFQTLVELRTALEQVAMEPIAKPTAQKEPSIAVLPFTNMSAEKENEYFGDGLAEEVINALAQMPGIKVSGRTSSFFFRGKDVELQEIGRRLNVDHILEGSVRRAGSRIRITAQLIKASDGFHLWSERYDRELTDIFAIQDEITNAIAGTLRVKLITVDARRRRYEPNLRAYEAYMTARLHWFKGTQESMRLFKQSVDRAIELDSQFALPYVLLCGYYSMVAHLDVKPALEAIPLARQAGEQALRLDPTLGEAQALLGVFDGTFTFDWDESERRFRLAMEQEPLSRDIRFWYGNHYLLNIGRFREAVEAMRDGLAGDPLNLLYRHGVARGLRHAGRLEEAEMELRKVLELDQNFPMALETLGIVCAEQGRIDEALAWTERAYAAEPTKSRVAGQLAALLNRAGERGRAGTLLEGLKSGMGCGATVGLAVFYAMSGELNQAAEWAAKAIEERHQELLKVLGPLMRNTSQWPPLARRMNLPI